MKDNTQIHEKTLQTQGLCKKVLMFILQLLRTIALAYFLILFLPSYLNNLKGQNLVSFTVFCVQKA